MTNLIESNVNKVWEDKKQKESEALVINRNKPSLPKNSHPARAQARVSPNSTLWFAPILDIMP